MGNIQGKGTEAPDRVAAVGEGLEAVVKAPPDGPGEMSGGLDEGVSGGGPRTWESSRSVAACRCLMTGNSPRGYLGRCSEGFGVRRTHW
jgi:hypothetical protein